MRMLTDTNIKIFRKQLYITLLFILIFYKLANKNFLVNGARIIINIDKKIISEFYLMF